MSICNVSADLLSATIDKFIFSEIEMNGIIQFVLYRGRSGFSVSIIFLMLINVVVLYQ